MCSGLRVRLENAGMIPVDAGRAAIRVCDTGEEHITSKKRVLSSRLWLEK